MTAINHLTIFIFKLTFTERQQIHCITDRVLSDLSILSFTSSVYN